MRFTRGIWANRATAVVDAHVLISSQTVTTSGGVASITFSSIPATYKHLRIHYFIAQPQSAGTNQVNAIINGDVASNYVWQQLYGNGTTAGSNGFTALNFANIAQSPGSSLTTPAAGVIDLLDYANTTTNKTFRALSGADTNGGGQVSIRSSLWLSTAAINSIQLKFDTAVNLPQNSVFNLYGMS